MIIAVLEFSGHRQSAEKIRFDINLSNAEKLHFRADAIEPLFFVGDLLGPHNSRIAFKNSEALPCNQEAATRCIDALYTRLMALPKTHGITLPLEEESMWLIKNVAALCTYVIQNPPKKIDPNQKWDRVLFKADKMLSRIALMARPSAGLKLVP